MIPALMVMFTIAGTGFGYFIARSVKLHLAVVWNGANLAVSRCKPTAAGVKTGKVELPYYGFVAFQGKSSVSSITIYFVAIESVELLGHTQMDQWRSKVLKGAMFRPGNDVTQLVQIGFYALAGGLVIWLALSVGTLAGNIADVALSQEVLMQRLESLEERLSQPLEVR